MHEERENGGPAQLCFGGENYSPQTPGEISFEELMKKRCNRRMLHRIWCNAFYEHISECGAAVRLEKMKDLKESPCL
ncbi:hypothetical protein CEXT_251861 [Caerostris extrusa]|uniref:Uncharacterized protein n=1 Tax=Caerostris extrusa TaxID=172846 RepID=A0AAV4WAQ3_CAEEX|nr:hypothetical protein CEXT_251861 [Caerostris extrusa]